MAYLEHVLASGQSLSIGSQGSPAISTVTEAANARGIHPTTGAVQASLAQSAGDQRPEFSMGYRIVEHIGGSQLVGFSTFGQGGQNIANLSKGGSTGRFEAALANVANAKAIQDAAAQSYRVRALHWIHGESDQQTGMTVANYLAALVALHADYEADILAATGQGGVLPLILSQTATWPYYGTAASVGLAQLKAARTRANTYLACPQYQLPYAVDNLHLTNVGYYRLGELHARAHNAAISGSGWDAFAPRETEITLTSVIVRFNVPVAPLVLDTATIPLQTNHGFSLHGTAATITAVTITAPDEVTLTTSAMVFEAGAAVGYGVSSGTYAGKGNLRDSETALSVYDGTPLPNWANHFKDDLGILVTIPPYFNKLLSLWRVGPNFALYPISIPEQY